MKTTQTDHDAFEAFQIHNKGGGYPALIVCEHASNAIPEPFGDLGLSQEALESHIAWDPGAAEVALRIAELLDATCVLGGISRLVHDCNRPPDAPDAMPAKSEVFEIPGNTDLSPEQRGFRVETVYKPFHACVAAEMTDRNALVTVHSFTPVYKGVERHVELGILHDEDTALADVMLSLSSGHPDLQIRRNEPYGPQDGVMHTLKVHGLANGIPNVMIEIRSDLIATKKACEEMAVILAHMISQGLDAVLASSTGRERHA